ncbi:DNA-binding GntR family transcriptional regulator [Rhizobium petrolearium]|uniref:GntR family transcriptional regulator n=1 Tax=Neorhizobium petrolearium TaxID=515361 RepID=UPI001AEB554B|nr:GntR family transcriptional regulator [Neorhizobium petrolearium]MBP1845673.1 DNA-binding GntR family transcriptional regulator [Neorhizobium petrolearium]
MTVSAAPPTETTGENAHRRIRADIISGALPPGSRLKIEQVRERYAVSASTLREILNHLAAETLVVAEGQRGFIVSPATRAELLELADLRILLEGHALRTSFAEGDLDWEARLVAAHHKLAAIERGLLQGESVRTVDWVRYDWEFHLALVSACRSASLMAMLSTVFDRFLRYHLLAESFRGQAVADDHRKLFELALKRDVSRAQAILAEHVHNGTSHVLRSGRFS